MSEDRRPPDDQEPTWLGSSEFEVMAEESVREERATPDEPDTPRRLGDFELLRELGRGGMGIVYEARQVSLNRRVALKVLPPGLGLTGSAVQRFEREAHAAAKLHHTNIVPVYAIGEEAGLPLLRDGVDRGRSRSPACSADRPSGPSRRTSPDDASLSDTSSDASGSTRSLASLPRWPTRCTTPTSAA